LFCIMVVKTVKKQQNRELNIHREWE